MDNILSITNNNLIVGNSAMIKDRLIIPYIKSCISNRHNIVVLDPDGRFLRQSGTLITENNYEIITINFNDVRLSNVWNPLLAPYREYKSGNKDKCMQLLSEIASVIMLDNVKDPKADPYWTNASIDYFIGLALILFNISDKEEQINIANIHRLAKEGDEKFGGSTYIKEYVTALSNDSYEIKYILATILTAPSETKGSIMSVFFQHLNTVYAYESVFNATSANSIFFDKIIKENTAVFINYSEDLFKDIPYIRLFLSLLSHTIVRAENNRKRYPFNFILADFLSINVVRDLDKVVIANNKIGNHFLFTVDSLSSVQRIYNEYYIDYLMSACKGLVFLPTAELIALEKINKLLSLLNCRTTEKLLPYYLGSDEVLVIEYPQKPIVIVTNDNDDYKPYYPQTVSKSISEMTYIDIKEIVKKEKQARYLQMMNEDSKNKDFDVIDMNSILSAMRREADKIPDGLFMQSQASANILGKVNKAIEEIKSKPGNRGKASK